MRIVHAMANLNRGEGAIAAAVGMMIAQRRAGIDVFAAPTEVNSHRDRAHLDQLESAGVSCVAPPARWRRHDDEAPECDVVHVHGLWDRGLPDAGRLARRTATPMVVTPHGMCSTWALRHARWKKAIYRRLVLRRLWPGSFTWHFTTDAEATEAQPLWQRTTQDSVVLPLSLDVAGIRAAASGLPGDPPPPRATSRAVFVGRVHPGKGVEYLVDALAHDPAAAWGLDVIGPCDDVFGQRLIERTREAGLGERATWHGPVYPPALYGMIARADALVLPSDHENFGLVAVEAVAAGIPVLLSDRVAVASKLVAAEVAALVSRQPAALAHELADWLDTDAGRTRLQQMRERTPGAAAQFDHAAVGERWFEVYQRLAMR